MGDYKYLKRSFSFEGKRYFVYGKDEKDCTEKMIRKKIELEYELNRVSKNMTVKDWVHEWLETYKEDKVNDRHYYDLCRISENFLIDNIGYMPLKKVKPLHLQKILNESARYSQSYVSKIYDVIHQVFYTAYANDLVSSDLTKGLVKPNGKKKVDRRAITDHERKLTLEVAKTHRGGLFVLIMLYCGLRPGEVAALRWNNIDLQKNVLRITQAVKTGNVVGDPKTAAGTRSVPIPVPLQARLREEKHDPFDLVCKNAHGRQHTKCSMAEMFRSFKREMIRNNTPEDGSPFLPVGEDLTLYCYRHTYCTDLQAAGVPINVAKELMGHSSIYVTAKIYTHWSEDAFNTAADLINHYAAGMK